MAEEGNAGVTQVVVPKPIEHEMRSSYIDYAMSVIVGRALPDARDGLKPVHRRILYAMSELGLASNKATKKSARVVGEVLGKYHPHGDLAVYDALVRMAQTFSLRYPLIEGQGNFGSVDGDSAAAMRYTECRLTRVAEELLEDLDKDTVDFGDNFDATLKEPLVLPGKFPNLLCNGSSGIAVGMATNVPPHNLREVCDGLVALIDNPQITIQDLAGIVRGPDFPTGGILQGRQGVLEAYATGRGIVRVRAKTHLEDIDKKGGKQRIIVDELPYQVNKANLLKDIAELVKEKKIDDIADLRDESDREGMRVVVELKKGANPDIVLNQLFAQTQLESSFGILNLALVDNQPRELNLKQLLEIYVSHREIVVVRRTKFLLAKATARAHVLEGLVIALSNIDAVIATIRAARDPEAAREALMAQFSLSAEQAKAILEMRLSKLTSLEIQGVKDELSQVRRDIARYEQILGSRAEVLAIIKQELGELREKYGDDRRTAIAESGQEIFVEDLIPDETVVVMTTNRGYIKRIAPEEYRLQNRGGKGLIGMETGEEDFVVDVFLATNHQYILFFTNKGKLYWLKAYKVPEGSRYSKGKAIPNLLEGLEEGEEVQTAIPVRAFSPDQYVFFATRKGVVKKTGLDQFANVRVTGIRALNLEEDDAIVGVGITDGRTDVVLAKDSGLSVRFSEADVRPMGRAAYGVKGTTFEPGENVVAMALIRDREKGRLLTITENGYGKRTPVPEYSVHHRGGKGIITIQTTERNGKVVSVLEVADGDEVIVTSKSGMVIRVPVETISEQGRNTQGVRIMQLEESDRIIAVARLAPADLPALPPQAPHAGGDGKPPVFPREDAEPAPPDDET
ncbi:MAG TPA: DNA gyrase subunit A [Candidatus Thermoplasmatota archaeon]|nr:DNA gyrase subunit A [Candidatus Thermoplasmatota archaeon]